MSSEDRTIQTKVGIFILIGLVTIGMMVVYFGRLGEGVQGYYNLRVEFPNAAGLIRGAEVLLAGAKIGRVGTNPVILENLEGVYVDLRIFESVKIPTASEFAVGSSGLLGDKFVVINLKPNAKESPSIEPGSTIQGVNDGGGIAGMTDDAGALVAELRVTVGNINAAVKKLDNGLLGDQNIASMRETIGSFNTAMKKLDNGLLGEKSMAAMTETVKNLQTTSASLAEASGKIDAVITKADTAISSGKVTMESATKAAEELQRTLSDIRSLVKDVQRGKGALGTLIGNAEVADNLRALVANLRKHGVLWYRDSAEDRKSQR